MKKTPKQISYIIKFIISFAFFSVLLTFVKSNKQSFWKLFKIYIPACAGLFFAGIVLWIWKAENPFKITNTISLYIFKMLHGIADKTRISFFLKSVLSLEKFYNAIIKKLNALRKELQIAVNAAKTDKAFLFRLISLTVLFYVLTWVNVYTAFKTLNIEVNFIPICAIVPAVMLVAHVPVTLLGNLGYLHLFLSSLFRLWELMVPNRWQRA